MIEKPAFDALTTIEKEYPLLFTREHWDTVAQFEKPAVILIQLTPKLVELLQSGEQLFTTSGVILSYKD